MLPRRNLRMRRRLQARPGDKRSGHRGNPRRQALSRHERVGDNDAQARDVTGLRAQRVAKESSGALGEASAGRGDRVERNDRWRDGAWKKIADASAGVAQWSPGGLSPI